MIDPENLILNKLDALEAKIDRLSQKLNDADFRLASLEDLRARRQSATERVGGAFLAIITLALGTAAASWIVNHFGRH